MRITIFPRPFERLARYTLTGALLLAAVVAHASVTDPFTADFKVHRSGVPLGAMTFQLAAGNPPGCHIYTGHAEPNALAQLFIGRISEESHFCTDANGMLRSTWFRHHIDGKPKDSYTLTFDWDAHKVTYDSETGRHKTMPLGDQALDPLSLQIAARRWLASSSDPAELGERAFTLVDENEIKPYRLRVRQGGEIDTPAGRYDTLKVERIQDTHHLTLWLARDADWIPVRVEQHKGDSGMFRMDIARLTRTKK